MDQNLTLQKLREVADLAKMVEEIVAPGTLERLTPASLSGIRVTLRALRETVLACHNSVANEQAGRTRPRTEIVTASEVEDTVSPTEAPAIVRAPNGIEQPRMVRKDLRSTLGQMIERSNS